MQYYMKKYIRDMEIFGGDILEILLLLYIGFIHWYGLRQFYRKRIVNMPVTVEL